MKQLVWLVLLAIAAGSGYWLWRLRNRWLERSRAAEERFATLMAQATPKANSIPKIDAADLSQQKLLLDAASRAGEAGEAVLSIQLYARLLARYPQTSFAGQARAAVEAQKKKLAKP